MAQSVVALPASRKIAGSIPDGVIGIFHRHKRFGRTNPKQHSFPTKEQ
jgi:hypothetical protein